jgi:hypothetical protein
MQELLVSSLVQADALAKLSIDKGVITREEFMKNSRLSGLYISASLLRQTRSTRLIAKRYKQSGDNA